MNILVSEWLRTKRTAIRWLTFFMPFFVAVCAIIYTTFRKGTTQEFIFEGFFTIWTAVIIPVGAGVLSGYIVYEEEMAGNGRILVRPSGTEPLLRVMAEAPSHEEVDYYVNTIADIVRAEIGIE